jgi:hypothetical protein
MDADIEAYITGQSYTALYSAPPATTSPAANISLFLSPAENAGTRLKHFRRELSDDFDSDDSWMESPVPSKRQRCIRK